MLIEIEDSYAVVFVYTVILISIEIMVRESVSLPSESVYGGVVARVLTKLYDSFQRVNSQELGHLQRVFCSVKLIKIFLVSGLENLSYGVFEMVVSSVLLQVFTNNRITVSEHGKATESKLKTKNSRNLLSVLGKVIFRVVICKIDLLNRKEDLIVERLD